MLEIKLEAIPNQTFAITLNNRIYEITLKACNGIMAVSITRDNVPILSGIRVVAGQPIIPYEYLEEGNFIILTANNDLPDYTKFGVSQTLIYADQIELDTLHGT